MQKNLYKEIASIEEEAGKILSEAEKHSNELLEDSNKEGLQKLSQKQAELKELKANTISAVLVEAERAKDAQLNKSLEKIEEMRKAAEKKKDSAKKLLLRRLSEIIGE